MHPFASISMRVGSVAAARVHLKVAEILLALDGAALRLRQHLLHHRRGQKVSPQRAPRLDLLRFAALRRRCARRSATRRCRETRARRAATPGRRREFSESPCRSDRRETQDGGGSIATRSCSPRISARGDTPRRDRAAARRCSRFASVIAAGGCDATKPCRRRETFASWRAHGAARRPTPTRSSRTARRPCSRACARRPR